MEQFTAFSALRDGRAFAAGDNRGHPRLPEGAGPSHAKLAAAAIRRIGACAAGAGGDAVDLGDFDPQTRAVIREFLGRGEVEATVTGEAPMRIEETSCAGVWRICRHDAAGTLAGERIEVGPVPAVIGEAARSGARSGAAPLATAGLMNAPAILEELRVRAGACRGGEPAHVVNLSLLPVSAADHAWLAGALGQGTVTILAHGFGLCRVTSTAMPCVWRVQYLNGSGVMVVDTLEVVDVPEVVPASREDIADSVRRLGEVAQWLETAD